MNQEVVKLMTIDERLDFIEFRQQLLFDNDKISRLLFEYEVTKDQYNFIMDIFDEYSSKVDSEDHLTNGGFEQKIYEVVPQHKGNYHFAEALALNFYEADRWTEVYTKLYGKV